MILDYEQCTNSIRKTCDAKGTKKSVTSFSDCTKACDEDENCKFIFHNPAGSPGLPCVIYSACEMFKDTKDAVGSIYSKDGNCPGNIFALNNLPVLVIKTFYTRWRYDKMIHYLTAICGTNQFTCDSQRCVPKTKQCNNVDDCGDNSD